MTYEAVVTTICRLELGREFMARLQNKLVCAAMFRVSCFGDYVNMLMGLECYSLLCHYLMWKEFTIFPRFDLQELLFPVHDYRVCFDRKAFCLITGLWFGDYFRPSFDFAQFRQRVFPFVLPSRSMRMAYLTHVFSNSLHQLNDADVVRVSLLYMLEYGFFGK